MEGLLSLFSNITNLDYKQVIMWVIGAVLIYLAIKRKMEPTLLLPIGFGTILVNLPMSGAITQMVGDILQEGPISILFESGIANELFPLLLFVGIGAMIDFGPLLSNPKLMIFGAASQFGIFFTLSLASLFGFELRDAASIAIIGAAEIGTLNSIVEKMQSASERCRFDAVGDILQDPNAVNSLSSYDVVAVAAFEKENDIDQISRQFELLRAWNKNILGAIIVK